VIDNGTIQLGVTDGGALGEVDPTLAADGSLRYFGLRHLPSGAEGINTGPLVFRRSADWVLDLSPGSAYVSMHAAADGSVRFTGDQLCPSEPPFNPPATGTGKTGTFTDDGPGNRGTVIDLKVGSLNPGQTATLTFYFGAASSAAAAQASIASLGMPTWAVAKPATAGNPVSGAPATFILGAKLGS
jgi:hypothetical protein